MATIVIGVIIGDNSILLSIVLLGGCVFDFGKSIYTMVRARKLMESTSDVTE